jgi:hypothetical protein
MSQLYGSKFYCHKCGKVAMHYDGKKWWCYMQWKQEPHYGICKRDSQK